MELDADMITLASSSLSDIMAAKGFWLSAGIVAFCVFGTMIAIYAFFSRRQLAWIEDSRERRSAAVVGAMLWNMAGYWFVTSFPAGALVYHVSPMAHEALAKGLYYTSFRFPMYLIQTYT